MKQHDKRKNQHGAINNGNYVASLNGTASLMPPKQLFRNSIKQPALQRKTSKGKGQTEELKTEGKEYQYQIALALADYDPDKVQGFDEFKPSGFRYNPSKSYNLAIMERQLGYRPVGSQKLGEHWADPGTEAGRVMKNQNYNHSRLIKNGKAKEPYQPSDELLSRQTFQQLGEEKVRSKTIATLQYCQEIKKAIQLKISDKATPTNEKNSYLAKDAKMNTAINQLLAAIGGVTEQEAPEISEANFALPIRWALSATLGAALMAGTALTLLVTVLFRDVHDTLEDVVDTALDDLLRDTGVDRGKQEEPSKTPKPVVPPGEEDKDDGKPLEWHPTTRVEKVIASKGIVGGLKEKKSKIPRKNKEYWWHAHHPWPKFMGGKEEQPKMGLQSYVHISMLHPMLGTYLKGKGYKVAVNKGPNAAPNIDFVERLKSDLKFKTKVMVDLMTFHADLNAMTNPKMPTDAFSLGIKHSFKNIR